MTYTTYRNALAAVKSAVLGDTAPASKPRRQWKRKPATEAQKAARAAKMQQLHDWTKQAPTDDAPNADFSGWQSCRRKLEQFSLKNQWLIYLQRPTATEVHSFQNWKKYGRSVKKGEAGLMIWVPTGLTKLTEEELAEDKDKELGEKPRGYVLGYVFDIEQTEPAAPKDWKRIDRYQNPSSLPGTIAPEKYAREIIDIDAEPVEPAPALLAAEPADAPQDAPQTPAETKPAEESYDDWTRRHVIFLDPFRPAEKPEPAQPELSGLGTVPGGYTPNAEPERTQLHQIPTSKGYTLSFFNEDGERIDLAKTEHTELEDVPF